MSALDLVAAVSQHPATSPVLVVALVLSWARVLVIRVRERRAEREHLAALSAMLPPAPERAAKTLVRPIPNTRQERTHAAA